jgi:tetratricopeptide (TPR) repeat protein
MAADTNADADATCAATPPHEWTPKFLCRSFKSPIVLSDGMVTSCTLDHRGRNRLGSIYEVDFESLIGRFGSERLLAMADPLRKPVCHSCYTKLPRWRDRRVPRADWINDDVTAQQKDDYRALFDPDKLVFNIELSSACNLRCTGCALADPQFRLSRGAANIDMDRLMAWLDGHVHRIAQVRLYHMGETWLHPRWFEFCRFLKAANPALTLFTSTSGMLLNTDDKLRQVVDAGIDHVMFSVHGAFQASAEAYMGKTFRIDTAFAAARGLIKLRGAHSAKPFVSWKYLLFEWNDSDEEIAAAQWLLDDIGCDEIHFTITSQPAPSKRYTMGSEAWTRLRAHCASLWPRALNYQSYTPMEAVYPGRHHRLKGASEPSGDPVPESLRDDKELVMGVPMQLGEGTFKVVPDRHFTEISANRWRYTHSDAKQKLWLAVFDMAGSTAGRCFVANIRLQSTRAMTVDVSIGRYGSSRYEGAHKRISLASGVAQSVQVSKAFTNTHDALKVQVDVLQLAGGGTAELAIDSVWVDETFVSNSNVLTTPAAVRVSAAGSSSLLAEGRKMLDDGREFEAVRLLQEGVAQTAQPTAAMHKLLGDALLATGHAVAATGAYEAALKIEPNPASEFTHLGLARSLRASSCFVQASAAYEAALRMRAIAGGRAYGEDVYLELRDVNLAAGNTAAAATAYQCWLEEAYLIENRSRVIYCPIAKNASTFLKTSLVLNSTQAEAFRASGKDAHVYLRQPQAGFRLGDERYLGDRRHFSFVVLRDPLERIVSAYAYIFVRPLQWRTYPDLPGRAVVREVCRRDGRAPDYGASVSFEAFVRHLARTTDADMDHHWRAQTAFFRDIDAFDLVGCVEQLAAVMAEITRCRGWTFHAEDRAARNTVRRERLTPDRYHRMSPRELAALPALPVAEQLLTDDLLELLTHRYAADLALYRSRFGEPRATSALVYPTGGALALHRQPITADAIDEPASPATVLGPPPLPERAPPSHPQGEFVLFAAPHAKADAPGTADAPLPLQQAILAALAAQASGSPARVVLRAGVYREQVHATGSPSATVPLVIEAESVASAILSGADIWTGWQQRDGLWQHAWPYRWGLRSAPPDYGNPYLKVPELMRRREMLVADGVVQRQVLDPARLVPGAYHVDEESATLSMLPAAGTSPESANMEVATRSVLLHLTTVAHLSLRGLRFQHDASGYFVPQTGALQLTDCTDVVIEDCQACDNNNKGVQIDGTRSAGIVLRRVAMNRNGCLGLLVSRASDLQLEDCETSFNNWRGNWCAFYRGSPCGMKIMRSLDVRIVGHRALRNLATGIWIDEDNHDVIIEAAQVFGNMRGVHIEATTGPVSIIRSSVVGNRQEPVPSEWRWSFGSGIAVTHARNVTVQRCFLSGSDVAQIGVRNDRPTRTLKDTRRGAQSVLFTADLHLLDNTIVADARGGWIRVPDAAFDGGRCFSSLRSDGNRFIGSAAGQDIYLASSTEERNTHTRLSLAEWRALTANDGGSTLDGQA